MAEADKKKGVEKRIERAKVRNLERALKEERLGLTAIGIAFAKTHGDADAMLGALENMVRAAMEDPRVSAKTKQAMLSGQQILERALAIHRGRPQPLFNDDGTPNT